jgi:hypothetical protein
MSDKPKLCLNPCETCEKKGLPLLLARYALMPSEIKAPKLSGPLLAPELNAITLGEGAHYGVRLLRSGYAYVFDEARKHWDEYFVTADGFLTKMPVRVRAYKSLPKPATEFACARNGVAPLAGVITIHNPKHATNVWIAFSDAVWTDAVFMQHQDAAHRQKHMTSIAISDGKVAPQPRTAPIEQVAQWLPEFKLPKIKTQEQFGAWCPHIYNSRIDQLDSFTQAIKNTRPEGGAAIVALHDPVGLAMEIAALMELRKVTFMNHDSVVKPRMAANAIASLEFGLKEQAKMAEVLAGEELAQRAEEGPSAYNPNPALWGTTGDPQAAQAWRTHTPEQLKKAADSAWKKYTHDRTGKERFSNASSKAWLKTYDEGFLKFDKEHISPLAKAHVAWLQHKCMISHMSCNYDSADMDSGAAYTAAFAAALQNTADKQPSYELYLKWFKSGQATEDNLLLRALSFNQAQLIEKLKETDSSPLDARAFPTDQIVDFVKDGLEKLPPGGKAAMALLMQNTGGALLSYFGAFAEGKAPGRAAATVAAISGMQFTRVTVSGHRGKFVQHMMASVMRLDPNLKTSHNQLGKAVAAQLKLLEVEGLPMKGTDKRSWLVVLDQEAVKDAAAKNLKGDALAKHLAQAIRSPDHLPSLQAGAFRGVVSSKGFDALGNVAIGIVQTINFTKLYKDYSEAMSHDQTEARNRLGAGVVAIAGSFGEATGLGLLRMQEAKLANAPGLKAARFPAALRFGGRVLGLGAGILVATLDFMKGLDENKKGDTGLSNAYFISSALGAGLAVAFFFASWLGPIGWLIVGIALLALLLITLFIEKNKDNKLQEWLARCHFGSNADKYPDAETEQAQLKLAFA